MCLFLIYIYLKLIWFIIYIYKQISKQLTQRNQMEQVKSIFYSQRKQNMYDRNIYDQKTILPLKYKEGPKAFDHDVESPSFTPLCNPNKTTPKIASGSGSGNYYTHPPIKTKTNTNMYVSVSSTDILYCDNV